MRVRESEREILLDGKVKLAFHIYLIHIFFFNNTLFNN